jgi:hypothetical protein
MILSVVKGLLIYVNVSQEHWTGFFYMPVLVLNGGWQRGDGERGSKKLITDKLFVI